MDDFKVQAGHGPLACDSGLGATLVSLNITSQPPRKRKNSLLK